MKTFPEIPLLPCPFCGSKALVTQDYNTNPPGYYVECDNLGLLEDCCCNLGYDWSSGEFFGEFESPEQAAQAWNHRSQSSANIPPETISTVRDALLWAQQNLGKITRPSPVDKALSEIDDLLRLHQQTIDLISRHKHLSEHRPSCPDCGRKDNVILKDWKSAPAEWKCRACGHEWPFDPPVTP